MFQEIGGSWLACPTGSAHPTGSAGPCRTWSLTRRCRVIGLKSQTVSARKILNQPSQVFVSKLELKNDKFNPLAPRHPAIPCDRGPCTTFQIRGVQIGDQTIEGSPPYGRKRGVIWHLTHGFLVLSTFKHLKKTCVSPCKMKKNLMYGFFSPYHNIRHTQTHTDWYNATQKALYCHLVGSEFAVRSHDFNAPVSGPTHPTPTPPQQQLQ